MLLQTQNTYHIFSWRINLQKGSMIKSICPSLTLCTGLAMVLKMGIHTKCMGVEGYKTGNTQVSFGWCREGYRCLAYSLIPCVFPLLWLMICFEPALPKWPLARQEGKGTVKRRLFKRDVISPQLNYLDCIVQKEKHNTHKLWIISLHGWSTWCLWCFDHFCNYIVLCSQARRVASCYIMYNRWRG